MVRPYSLSALVRVFASDEVSLEHFVDAFQDKGKLMTEILLLNWLRSIHQHGLVLSFLLSKIRQTLLD